jgi:hypothetical protein
MPLFVFLALIALMFWPSKVAEEVEAKEAHVGPAKGALKTLERSPLPDTIAGS